MYKGTLSSFFENTFRYEVQVLELPFNLISPVKNELCVISDSGKKSFIIDVLADDEIIYLKSSSAVLIIEKPCKVKCTLKDITIKKVEKKYEISFASITTSFF